LGQIQDSSISSKILTAWIDLHCKMVRQAKGIAHVAYSRHFSYTSIAAYESIVASKPGYHSVAGQVNALAQLPSIKKKNLYPAASLNAAYAAMLRKYYGSFLSCNATIDSMEKAQHSYFSKTVNTRQLNNSISYGKAIAEAIIKWADADGSVTNKTYTILNGEGIWKPASNAAAPFWSENRSITKNLLPVFNIKSPAYSNSKESEFYKMADEVYTISQNLNSEQRTIALYWDDSPDGRYMTAFGHWASIFSGLVKQYSLKLIDATAAYAKMMIAMHEACILAWKGKYEYNTVRPISFIQQYISKQWQPLISTPPHPEFPAAHATLSAAAATTLSSIFGADCKVTDQTYIDLGMKPRSYSSLQKVAEEAGISRLYGGIHYRYSIEQGFILGTATAKHVEQSLNFH
jgi:hypothetical protein